jgi:hypothetical protein
VTSAELVFLNNFSEQRRAMKSSKKKEEEMRSSKAEVEDFEPQGHVTFTV